MSETRKTIMFGGVAIALALLAFVTSPRLATPDAFLDQGEPFFPEFTDPNTARTLEVIDFDEATGAAVPFKVTNSGGKWTIPSHHDHPADGKDRLAQTAAGVIGIKKDDFRSDDPTDHEGCGVIDPLDNTATTLNGRGQRVTIKGDNSLVLADFIIGNEVEGGEGFRFVRVPDQKRVYAVRMNIDISTQFRDWIESDLLQLDKQEIESLTLRDYSINERTGRIDERDVLMLDKKDDAWTANGMTANQEVDKTKLEEFLTTLDQLVIEGVRPKPEGLSVALTETSDSLRINSSDLRSLQGKGFYFSRDGRLLSNEGELQARTQGGVTYTLRFGEIVYGSGLAVTAGATGDGQAGPGENRYLFITTEFDPSRFPELEAPTNQEFRDKPDSLWTQEDIDNKAKDHPYNRWRNTIRQGHEKSSTLNARFATWYYVISSESFDKLDLSRQDLVKAKEES